MMFALATLVLLLCSTIFAETDQISATRTSWQYIRAGIVNNGSPMRNHGDITFYAYAPNVPDQSDSRWAPCGPSDSWCIDGSSLSIQSTSRLRDCWLHLDFSFFQTIVTVPAGVTVSTFTINFAYMDDGARITIYNSVNPAGLIVQNSYCFLGNSASNNLVSLLAPGVNRVIITQVDDCAVGNNIDAVVSLNGNTITPSCTGDGMCLSAVYDSTKGCVFSNINDGSNCNDGNLCTVGDQCLKGVCVGTQKVCPGSCGQAGICNLSTGNCPARSAKQCYCETAPQITYS